MNNDEIGNLVLGRYEGQAIFVFCEDIEIKVIYEGIHRGQARLRFIAPKSVDIVREELLGREDNEAN